MASSRNITVRVSMEELAYIDGVAESKKMNRSDMIKNAVKIFDNYEKPEPKPVPITEKASEIASEIASGTKTKISDFSHPLMRMAEEKGIVISDENGNTIETLKNLKDILDFVKNRVLNFK